MIGLQRIEVAGGALRMISGTRVRPPLFAGGRKRADFQPRFAPLPEAPTRWVPAI